ncbi:ComF family protein [Candidatus Uhrbacteria bacterium]|nr:ComF family protein [Candidatus Uhrbacteria bacterium]
MLFRSLLDILYPPTCVTCGEDGSWFCDACQRSVFSYHQAQESISPFSSIITTGSYANPKLRQMLTTFKYHSASCLQGSWEIWLKRFRDQYAEPWPWANLSELVVTSIPGDPRRLRERGMDHASLLADMVTRSLVPWAQRETLLQRVKHLRANATLPADATRQVNIRGAFSIIHPVHAPVLLIDDILTTGATAQEAARMLLAAGAPSVHLFTIAKGK